MTCSCLRFAFAATHVSWHCRALLKETKVSASSRYSKVREDLRGDERYKAMSSSQREAAFKLYQADLKARTSTHDTDVVQLRRLPAAHV